MNTVIKALKSRTVWTLVFAFAFNGFQAVSGTFSPEVYMVINAVFTMLATVFKLNPSQEY